MKKIRIIQTKLHNILIKRPLASFYGLLTLLLIVIALIAYLGKPSEIGVQEVVQPKPVTLYTIGSPATIKTQGNVEKTGVITIVAQSSGIITSLPVNEGQIISAGKQLVTISTTYTGANIAIEQAALAHKQYQFQESTRTNQLEIIGKQREIAMENRDNTEELRQLTEESLIRSRNQLSRTEEMIREVEASLRLLESASNSAENNALISSTKQMQSQFLSARDQLQSVISQTEYQISQDNPPNTIAELSLDLTLKQLDIQAKSIDLNVEVARLNSRIAKINASLSAPVAPFSGKIERIHVRLGQQVNPGMPLITMTGEATSVVVAVMLPAKIATSISKTEPATAMINGSTHALPITHISAPLSDQLVRMTLSVPQSIKTLLNDQELITVALPVGYAKTQSVVPVIPIDAVHITQESAYVFTVDNNIAKAVVISLGRVIGDKVFVLEGLEAVNAIILERNLFEGDVVSFN